MAEEMEKSNVELIKSVVQDGRVLTRGDGLFSWASLETELLFEAMDRGWDADEIRDLIEYAFSNVDHA
jgi:hypothetical protein